MECRNRCGLRCVSRGLGLHYSGLITKVDTIRFTDRRDIARWRLLRKIGPVFRLPMSMSRSLRYSSLMMGMTRVLPPLPLLNGHPFAFFIEVPNIEMDKFAATNAEPPERFDQTSIPKISRPPGAIFARQRA